jgi:anhydro-N-acetylmuramic acid kinase
MTDLYIGLMSGTSLDGIDGVLVDFAQPAGGAALKVLAHAHRPFDAALAAELLALNSPGGADELHRTALAANALARAYSGVVADLQPTSGVVAIGAHGQTVRHRPGEFDGTGYTVQMNNPALLAEMTGIDVVADFRTRDVAAGGQGAPLVPAFHRAVFARTGRATAVLNLGGIANLTSIRPDGSTIGFDCGPANALMDLWSRRHTGAAYDAGGAWAATGKVDAALLARLRSEPFFALSPPKSTGRDLFHADWLGAHLSALPTTLPPANVQATLAELTASVAADAVRREAPGADELLVCGGGAFNAHLMQRLSARLPGVRVMPSDERGLPANQVEACAFAWLARAWTRRDDGNLASVTGARGGRVLGALYPH